MKKLSVFTVAAFACLCIIGVMSGEVFADGDETLGPPSIDILPDSLSGSGIVAAGVGMIETDVDLGGDISVYVPHGADIQQVLLYFEGRHDSTFDCNETMEVQVRKRGPLPESDWEDVEGVRIGGPTEFVNSLYTSTYRADVTDFNLVAPGHSRFSVKGLDFVNPDNERTANDGAGVIVIFKDGSGKADVQLVDGNDFAFKWSSWSTNDELKTTVPQTFNFVLSSVDRTATLSMLFSSVAGTISGGGFRASIIKVTTYDVDSKIIEERTYCNLLNSWDGEEFDSVNLDVAIRAGASSLTVEALSEGTPDAASFNWIVAALSVPEPEEDCGCEGKVTDLTLRYTGATSAEIKVVQKKDDLTIFGPTQVISGGVFSFFGNDKHGTMGTEILIYVDEALNTKIHTSCSQPIGPGLQSDDFLVIEGESRNGGPLCPL